jgi:hypothetical protein
VGKILGVSPLGTDISALLLSTLLVEVTVVGNVWCGSRMLEMGVSPWGMDIWAAVVVGPGLFRLDVG